MESTPSSDSSSGLSTCACCMQDLHCSQPHSDGDTTSCNFRRQCGVSLGSAQPPDVKLPSLCRRCWVSCPWSVLLLVACLSELGYTMPVPFLERCGSQPFSKRTHASSSRAVKAVHVELVSDLTTEAFLATLHRFIACHGLPTLIWSDHGTNLVGAKRELKELYQFLEQGKPQGILSDFCASRNIEWRFIPEH